MSDMVEGLGVLVKEEVEERARFCTVQGESKKGFLTQLVS
jgi:hypothetical protein